MRGQSNDGVFEMDVFVLKSLWRRGRWGIFPICILAVMFAGCPGAPNDPPAANAGADQVVGAGSSVTLDGSASTDPDGDDIGFVWRQILGPPVSLSSTTERTVTFTAPDTSTALTFELSVTDGQNMSFATVRVSVQLAESSARVEEMVQRSVTEDPAVMGNFPQDWLIPEAGAGLPKEPPAGEEVHEFRALFAKSRAPKIVQEELAPGATRSLELPLGGPSGLASQVQWIGTTSPLDVSIALDGALLSTGTSYQMGHDRGGAYVRTQTGTGGVASVSVTNTSGVPVKIRMTFMATTL
jgi:hypothetical protein